jgi:hypothetical protein
MTTPEPICIATTPRGPCRAKPMTGQPTCYLHGPDAAAARSRGGRAKGQRAQGPPLDSTGPQAPDLTTGPKIITTLDRAAKAMAAGDMSAREAAALASLGRLALATLAKDQAVMIRQLQKIVAQRQPQALGGRR